MKNNSIGDKIVKEYEENFDNFLDLDHSFLNLSEIIDKEFLKLRQEFLDLYFDPENAKWVLDKLYRERGL